jgi:2',3'-cyclic-nucleotide 2'-phosphodiesterase/3'-nucleotidase
MYKRLLTILALAASIALVSCATAVSENDAGSLDRHRVDLLPDGTAKSIDILAFNDFHATIAEDPLGKNVGIAKMATVVDNYRLVNPNTVIVSGGDNYQGSALSIVTKGKIVNDFFKYIRVAASTVGNHEFDWGDGYFGDWSRDGGFPFVVANILDKKTGSTPAWAKPYVIVTVGGHRVAFIGLATRETVNSVKAANIADYDFTDPAEAARHWATVLRATERPEVIIVISHIPSATDELDPRHAVSASAMAELAAVCRKAEIDALVTGHSHMAVNASDWGIPVLQSGYNGRSFGRIHIVFGGKKPKITTDLVDFYKDKATIAINPTVQGIVDSYNAKYGALFLKRVATLNAELAHDRLLTPNVSPMGAWVCDVLRDRFAVDVAIMNGGGIRKGFLAGNITVQDFWDLMPFDNTAVLFRVKGSGLKKIVDHGIDSLDFGNGQFAGLTVRYNPSRPYGAKIVSMTLSDGRPVEDDAYYTVMTNDFVFEGGDQYSMIQPSATDVNYTYVTIRDVLIEAAEKQGTMIVPKVDCLVPVSD